MITPDNTAIPPPAADATAEHPTDGLAEEYWEQWCRSTAEIPLCLKRGAKVTKRKDGRKWINYRDEINGRQVIVEMPDNASTKSCDQQRHDDSPHRLGGPQENGIYLKLGLNSFRWRCGCVCHRDPIRAGRLF